LFLENEKSWITAENMFHAEHKTICFCSAQHWKTYAELSGTVKPASTKVESASTWTKSTQGPKPASATSHPAAMGEMGFDQQKITDDCPGTVG